MIRIWFDQPTGVLAIERFGVFPAGVLSVETRGDRLALVPPAGKAPVAPSWNDVANASGQGFGSLAAARAYLVAELAKRPTGPVVAPQRIDVLSPAATWTLAHTRGRVPMVEVYLASGEQVIADVFATDSTITVTHATPTPGFVLAF